MARRGHFQLFLPYSLENALNVLWQCRAITAGGGGTWDLSTAVCKARQGFLPAQPETGCSTGPGACLRYMWSKAEEPRGHLDKVSALSGWEEFQKTAGLFQGMPGGKDFAPRKRRRE